MVGRLGLVLLACAIFQVFLRFAYIGTQNPNIIRRVDRLTGTVSLMVFSYQLGKFAVPTYNPIVALTPSPLLRPLPLGLVASPRPLPQHTSSIPGVTPAGSNGSVSIPGFTPASCPSGMRLEVQKDGWACLNTFAPRP
jgi:hypothetical protein